MEPCPSIASRRTVKLTWMMVIAAVFVSAATTPVGANDYRTPFPDAFEGTFSDDDDNVHEANIEFIAEKGITLGCGNNRFCPAEIVTRAQMAAFLYRAVEHLFGTPNLNTQIQLADVADDAWYKPYAQWAANNNVIRTVDGNFYPGGTVTRVDIAEMLTAAFDYLITPVQPQGIFADTVHMAEDAISAIESVHATGITQECVAKPLLYCPYNEVARAEAASFIARAILRAKPTVGLVVNQPESAEGYLLFTPRSHSDIYLIDSLGRKINTWTPQDDRYFYQAKLLANGNLMVMIFGSYRSIAEIDSDGRIVWEYTHPGMHHDFLTLPNGNVLLLLRATKTREEAIAAGANPKYIATWGLEYDYLLEIKPTGPDDVEVVWEWSAWDHIVQDYDPEKENYGTIAEHPERIDINYVLYSLFNDVHRRPEDWMHGNAVDYHPELDQIMLSPKHYGELWVIDHSTTTEEAASEKGDLLYRWGNPRVYGAGAFEDQQLFWAHNTQWIPPGLPGEGNILILNNGDEFQGFQRWYSSVDEITPPPFKDGSYQREPGTAFGPSHPVWTYTAENATDFYARNTSGTQRLPNGNTLVLHGPHGTVFQVTSEGATVWKYINPVLDKPMYQGDTAPIRNRRATPYGPAYVLQNTLHLVEWYSPDHPGLQALDLTPEGPIELYP